MDHRRFRFLGVAAVLAATLVLNGGALVATFNGDYPIEYTLARYIAGLAMGYVGLRIMESILFRPKNNPSAEPAQASGNIGRSSSSVVEPTESAPEEMVN